MKHALTIGALILAGITGIGFVLARRENADLTAQVTRISRQNAELRYEAKQASTEATDIGRRAVELDAQLGSAKTRGTATEAKNHQLARELTAREQREVALMAELAELRQKSATPAATEEPVLLPTLFLTPGSSAKPAAHAPSSPPAPAQPSVDAEPYRQRIAELEAQLVDLLTRSLAEIPADPASAPTTAAVAAHQVVRVGPADTFVVLDYGADHGARPDTLLRVYRGTSELARVQISDVRPRFSLAQVQPGTLKGQLQTGDLVVFPP